MITTGGTSNPPEEPRKTSTNKSDGGSVVEIIDGEDVTSLTLPLKRKPGSGCKIQSVKKVKLSTPRRATKNDVLSTSTKSTAEAIYAACTLLLPTGLSSAPLSTDVFDFPKTNVIAAVLENTITNAYNTNWKQAQASDSSFVNL